MDEQERIAFGCPNCRASISIPAATLIDLLRAQRDELERQLAEVTAERNVYWQTVEELRADLELASHNAQPRVSDKEETITVPKWLWEKVREDLARLRPAAGWDDLCRRAPLQGQEGE